MPAGRPTKLNKKIQDRICQALLSCCSQKGAAAYGGIGEKTFYQWMRWGKERKGGKYQQFRQAVKRAEDESEAMLLSEIRMDKAWQSNAWIMERRWPNRWAKPERHEISGPEGKPIEMKTEHNLKNLTLEEKRQLLALVKKSRNGHD